MAQYDVHRIQSDLDPNTPFVVVVQSSQYDRYRRRVVVPLKRYASDDATEAALAPEVAP